MAELLAQFMDTDLVLIASPVYAFSVSSHVKHFMERTLALLSPGAEIDESGFEHNRWRYPGRGPKRLAAILVAGGKSVTVCAPAIGTLELYAAEMRMRCSGVLVRPESCALRFPVAKPRRAKAVLAGFERAGVEFVTEERISQTVLNDVSAPLIADLPHFVRYSRIYWEHALAKGDECDAAGAAAGNDVRILIQEMARNVSPAATGNVTATIQFDFPDRGLAYTVALRHGTCSIAEGTCAGPDLLIRCPAALWVAVVQRTISGAQLLKHPELRLEGDLPLFRRLPRYFPPPPD
jgi:hypothetical protein